MKEKQKISKKEQIELVFYSSVLVVSLVIVALYWRSNNQRNNDRDVANVVTTTTEVITTSPKVTTTTPKVTAEPEVITTTTTTSPKVTTTAPKVTTTPKATKVTKVTTKVVVTTTAPTTTKKPTNTSRTRLEQDGNIDVPCSGDDCISGGDSTELSGNKVGY